jgi:hypothetical protein
MDEYDGAHWEALIGTIIERLGAERFVEMAAYVLEERGFVQVASRVGALQHLAAAEAMFEEDEGE